MYFVESVDANEMHDKKPCWIHEGDFATLAEAIGRAQAVVRKSLAEFGAGEHSVDQALAQYQLYGAIPFIHGRDDSTERSSFNPYEYAADYLRSL
jgi:hypothetical protein